MQKRRSAAIGLAAVSILFSVPVHSAPNFKQLKEILGEREAIVVYKRGSKAVVYNVNRRNSRELFTTSMVKRNHDIFGAYTDFPLVILSADRERLIYETNQPLNPGDQSPNPNRRLGIYDFNTLSVSADPAEEGSVSIQKIDQTERNLSPRQNFYAGEFRERSASISSNVAQERKSSLILAKVLDTAQMRRMLMPHGGSPPLDDPLFEVSLQKIATVKTYVKSEEWQRSGKGEYCDIRFLDWRPDEKSFIWLESDSAANLNTLRPMGNDLYSYDTASKRITKLASFNFPEIPGPVIANPLFAISNKYTVVVSRTMKWGSVSYTTFFIDVDSPPMRKILNKKTRLVGLR